MDGQNKPTARKKRILGAGKGIEKKGEGLGTGPVGQSSSNPAPGNFGSRPQRPSQSATGGSASQGPRRPSQSTPSYGRNDTAQRPSQYSSPFGGNDASQRPAENSFGQQSRPGAPYGAGRQNSTPGRPSSAYRRTTQSGSGRPAGGQRSGSPVSGGGGGKLLLLIAAAAIIFFFGRNLFSGNEGSTLDLIGNQTVSTQGSGTQNSGTQGSGTQGVGTGTSSGSLMNLLSSFMSGSESSAYDFSGILSGLSGSGSQGTSSGSVSQYFTSSMENNTPEADLTVSSKARDKYTVLRGGNNDTVTILVYMCGADLESQNGMGTADLKEMLNATISEKMNLIVFTGGCRRWRNNVVTSNNQIYRIQNGKLTCLKENAGTASMTNPDTLAGFIRFGKENYPANRMCLIFWDHGGGSISGYGYDERYGQGQTMTLAGINQALKNGGVQFDFIGFDTCLMATVENGLMLEQYADYMIASEETDPGLGWYYTNWLSRLSANTSMSTVQIGKTITDDFVDVCNQKCRGQATTLSVVDLAELSATVPGELKNFSIGTNELIQSKQYKTVSSARSKTREFAQQSRIDQIDLVHFANNMGTKEGKQLAKALQGAVKYNRTGGGISNAYGLSIYFPYKKTGKVSQMVSTYKAIGMDDEYTRCIQEFASLELSGQLSAGSSLQNYGGTVTAPGGLLESLTGNGGSYYSGISGNYSGNSLESLLGGFYGGGSGSGGSTGSILDLLMGRSLSASDAAEYIRENHFDPSSLVWKNGRISLSSDQWGFIASVNRRLYYDDGSGYIDMGYDGEVQKDGNDLVYGFDGTWLSIDRQPVAYYPGGYIETEECYVETGFVPAYVNGIRANLILVFDQDNPYGYIAGAERVYLNGETEAAAKNMIAIGRGDKIQFVCDYYDYDGKYQDSYRLGDEIVLGDTVEIGNTYVDADRCRMLYCLTDYYQQDYWTPAV